MTAAEKIRQVVEEFKGGIHKEEHPVGGYFYMLDRQDIDALVTRVVDVIIGTAESRAESVIKDHPNSAAHIQIGMQNAYIDIFHTLKEARTSITNSTHE